jgi:cytochrome c6
MRALLCAAGWTLALLCAPVFAGDPQHGADVYRRHCAGCHGAGGRPLLPGAPDFSRATALLKSDLALAATIRSGRGGMPAYAGVLREREMLDVVAHLRTLR